MMLLPGSANHDDRRFPDGDTFDIHRTEGQAPDLRLRDPSLPGSSAGPPRRSGSPLRRSSSGSPTWEVDMDRAALAPTSTVRGWETLPAFTS